MISRLLVMAALVAAPLSGCEHGTDIEGTVIVPIEVQQRFSAEAPGQLLVVATLPSPQGELRDEDTVFCMPENGERRITARASNFGCAEAGLTRVSAYAVPRAAADIDCSGAGSVRSQHAYAPNDPLDPDGAVAFGSVEVPLTTSGIGGCQDGHIAFTITLAQ